MTSASGLDSPQPLSPQHTGSSGRSYATTRSGTFKQPSASRRSSISSAVNGLDINEIGKPPTKEQIKHQQEARTPKAERPGHKRSFTGSYFPAGANAQPEWPLGDEQTWKDALKADDDTSVQGVATQVVRHATTTLARQAFNLDELAAYQATAHAVRDQLIRRWNDTAGYHTKRAPKRVYYLSLEFLMGRTLDNAVLNLGVRPTYETALQKLGFNFEDLLEEERDAALGNGGLGRLASCYMDSMATLSLPGWGYGIKYTFGIFKQLLDVNGTQLEAPDPWLERENPWEISRLDVNYNVRFYGHVEPIPNSGKAIWSGGQEVLAVASDVPVPGFGTKNVSSIRLWSAKPISGFDLNAFNAGNYAQSVAAAQSAETITRVLYPNDQNWEGKELRLKQQYLLCCASLADILRRFRKLDMPWEQLPDMVVVQMNDTHPTLCILELMRVLLDEEDISWETAWKITTKVFAYTNHTVLPEALEKWPVPLFESLLPRHLIIAYGINYWFLQDVAKRWPGDYERLKRMSLIEEGEPKSLRMAYLAVVGSFKVNGVAALHSQLIKATIFKDFVEFFGVDKFTNVTNGITPRRWLHQCNPELSQLITQSINTEEWLMDLQLISGIVPLAEHPGFRKAFHEIKVRNKERLADLVERELGITVDPTAMFTVQIKRLHEYKRQTLNIFGIIHRYLAIKAASPADRKKFTKHVAIFAGKAAPGYYLAKLVIRLIVNVSKIVNNDPEIGDLLKVIFVPDYSVSIAEVLVPAADVSVQISTAGTEASGTSNMKLAINGSLLLGTCDGANIEIAEEAGEDQCFLFGHLSDNVERIRYDNQYQHTDLHERSPELAKVFKAIESNTFNDGGVYEPLLRTVYNTDYYLVSNDFASYLEAESLADDMFANDHDEWIRKTIITCGSMATFSSDRAVQAYADEIWSVEPEKVPENYTAA